ncbi:MAG: rhomboid family intramembrane serine protease [Candidatus Eremiobacteraeota bacterium]|nr:rhomboid family intramembrane serine protease [Candidatus Eremiobacteraeota bacterium]
MRPVWSSPSRNADTPAVYALMALCGIVFIIDFFAQNRLGQLLLWPVSVEWLRSLEIWRPFTFPFTHATSLWYLLGDGMVLYFFGGSLERAWGSARFLFFFFASGIVPGLVELALSPVAGGALFFGMIGSAMSMVVAFAAMNPYATVLLYFFPLQARWLGVLAVAFELFGRSVFYGGAVKELIAVALTAFFAYSFTVSRFSFHTMFRGGGPSLSERFERWRQRRRMRDWQRRVSRIERPEDLFKKDK